MAKITKAKRKPRKKKYLLKLTEEEAAILALAVYSTHWGNPGAGDILIGIWSVLDSVDAISDHVERYQVLQEASGWYPIIEKRKDLK